jgi:hypothetical protein
LSKKALYSNDDTERLITESPERTLWLAVIERALKDYCFFFDRLQRYENCNNFRDIDRFQYNPKSRTHGNAVAEFERLRWFLFDLQPIEFNLTYLSLVLYDNEGFAFQVRKAADKYFKRHLDQTKEKGIFPHIIAYIVENSPADSATAALEDSPLRFKRYRIDSDI